MTEGYTQVLKPTEAAQRYGAAEYLRQLAEAVEKHGCEVEVREVVLHLQAEEVENLQEVEL